MKGNFNMEKLVCPVCKREFVINENDRKSYAINDERVCSVDCFLKAVLTPQNESVAAYVPAQAAKATEVKEEEKEPFVTPEITITVNKTAHEDIPAIENAEHIKDAGVEGASGPQGNTDITKESKTVKKTNTSNTTRKTTTNSSKKTSTTTTKNKTVTNN